VIVIDEPVTRDVNITNTLPIPVTITNGAGERTVVSVFIRVSTPDFTGTLLTVPADKHFILTDILLWYESTAAQFSLLEGTIKKCICPLM
jgi:hypothetical protein